MVQYVRQYEYSTYRQRGRIWTLDDARQFGIELCAQVCRGGAVWHGRASHVATSSACVCPSVVGCSGSVQSVQRVRWPIRDLVWRPRVPPTTAPANLCALWPCSRVYTALCIRMYDVASEYVQTRAASIPRLAPPPAPHACLLFPAESGRLIDAGPWCCVTGGWMGRQRPPCLVVSCQKCSWCMHGHGRRAKADCSGSRRRRGMSMCMQTAPTAEVIG